MSDHFSAPRVLIDPSADLTDLFAFTSPSRHGWLVLVLDVFPSAGPGALFSDAINYRFRLRPATIPESGAHFDVGTDEFAITCTFSALEAQDGSGQSAQAGACRLPNGEVVSFRVGDEHGGVGHGARVFAGLRSDPNFIDQPGYVATEQTRRLAFRAKGANLVEGQNVLSIVIELDAYSVLGSAQGTLFAVAAETVTAGRYPMRLERFGRVEMKNTYLSQNGADMVNRDIDLRDLYDQEDPFQLSPYYLGAYRARLSANLHLFDTFDGKIDWPLQPDGTHPLTELLLADYMVVDCAKPFAADSYLEIERALLEGREHTTCGGRWLDDDAIDMMATLVISAGKPRVTDGVDEATVRASQSFPYLAPPNANQPAATSRAVFPSKLADQAALLDASIDRAA